MLDRLCSFDLETHLLQQGLLTPPIICGSWARSRDDKYGLVNYSEASEIARVWLAGDDAGDDILVGANLAFDIGCLAAVDPSILSLVFKAYDENRIHDVLIAQALDAVEGGHLGLDPRSPTRSKLRDPATGKEMHRYSLSVCSDLVLGRVDAKANDFWRLRYALLENIPIDQWPEEARVYPCDDAQFTLEVAKRQIVAMPWHDVFKTVAPARNLSRLPDECRAALALHLGAIHGFRTDRDSIEKLSAAVEKKNAEQAGRWVALGFMRPDDSGDTATLKRAIGTAYGASGTCKTCGGVGKVKSTKTKNDITCKVILDDVGGATGCDGTGFDLATAPMLPHTPKGGIKTDRDTLMESGDENLYDYGEDEYQKIRTTYLPYLRKGIDAPLTLKPNVVLASLRVSYSDPIQQFPRKGGVRECVVARPDTLLCSTDYSSGELCTLGQASLWVVGYSKMVEAINESGDPGILHAALGAEMLGVPIDEFRARMKAKDQQAIDFRQAAKAGNFGLPGAMGAPTFVLSKRKKSEGFTEAPGGPVLIEDEHTKQMKRGYWGIRFCVLLSGAERCGVQKITEWKGRPYAPVCRACVEVVEGSLKPAFFRRWPEVRDMHDWVKGRIETDGRVPILAADEDGKPTIVAWRGDCGLTDGSNTLFQSLLAVISKAALWNATKEAYLDHDSPLWGTRFPGFFHDELMAEVPVHIAHLAGDRISEVMVAAGSRYAPDIKAWKAEPALSKRWSKSMESVRNESGQLIEWQPKGGW